MALAREIEFFNYRQPRWSGRLANNEKKKEKRKSFASWNISAGAVQKMKEGRGVEFIAHGLLMSHFFSVFVCL